MKAKIVLQDIFNGQDSNSFIEIPNQPAILQLQPGKSS